MCPTECRLVRFCYRLRMRSVVSTMLRCPSVRPSVTLADCIKTVESSINHATLDSSPRTLVLVSKNRTWHLIGSNTKVVEDK